MKEFIKKMFSTNDGVSSKRVTGFTILITELIIINIFSFLGTVISKDILDLHNSLIYVGTILIGAGIADGIVDIFKKK